MGTRDRCTRASQTPAGPRPQPRRQEVSVEMTPPLCCSNHGKRGKSSRCLARTPPGVTCAARTCTPLESVASGSFSGYLGRHQNEPPPTRHVWHQFWDPSSHQLRKDCLFPLAALLCFSSWAFVGPLVLRPCALSRGLTLGFIPAPCTINTVLLGSPRAAFHWANLPFSQASWNPLENPATGVSTSVITLLVSFDALHFWYLWSSLKCRPDHLGF